VLLQSVASHVTDTAIPALYGQNKDILIGSGWEHLNVSPHLHLEEVRKLMQYFRNSCNISDQQICNKFNAYMKQPE
jgi:hypothetical protein